MKTQEQYFADWQSHAFGFGYGTGEIHMMRALKNFMGAVGTGDTHSPHSYNYKALEKACGPEVAWLLISRLCQLNIINYGTSPRYAWLDPEGVKLKEFVDARTVEELESACDNGMGTCYPDHCNCQGEMCQNPFWSAQQTH